MSVSDSVGVQELIGVPRKEQRRKEGESLRGGTSAYTCLDASSLYQVAGIQEDILKSMTSVAQTDHLRN